MRLTQAAVGVRPRAVVRLTQAAVGVRPRATARHVVLTRRVLAGRRVRSRRHAARSVEDTQRWPGADGAESGCRKHVTVEREVLAVPAQRAADGAWLLQRSDVTDGGAGGVARAAAVERRV